MTTPGLIVAAPSSGSGKTLVTLGLLRALAQAGVRVASAKVGPDYIDPAFHAAAAGRPAINLDSWAMRPQTLAALAAGAAGGSDLLVCEGVMGLLDGAQVDAGQPDGSTAELAAMTGWPVVLVVDCRGMGASAAAVVKGFAQARAGAKVVGAIFNRVGSERHRRTIEQALASLCPEVEVLGFLPKIDALEVPSRHLGLVQAVEHPSLVAFMDAAARLIAGNVELDAFRRLARPMRLSADGAQAMPLVPLGQRIWVARDEAFAFAYEATLEGWRAAGAEIALFSPLADQGPGEDADAVYLPGGYPELHAARLAANRTFMGSLHRAAARDAVIWGECGGYMVLGRSLVDATGATYPMAGLLPVDTSFQSRRRHLGYRRVRLLTDCPLGRKGEEFRGHEFHYATVIIEEGERLFAHQDAAGDPLADTGTRKGKTIGSFLHLIDRR